MCLESLEIDLAASPFVPRKHAIVEHAYRHRSIRWTDRTAILHLHPAQQCGRELDISVLGHRLLQAFPADRFLNASVLDRLLENQEHIPPYWRFADSGESRRIYFWGTLYKDVRDGTFAVRSLVYEDGKKGWDDNMTYLSADPRREGRVENNPFMDITQPAAFVSPEVYF